MDYPDVLKTEDFRTPVSKCIVYVSVTEVDASL